MRFTIYLFVLYSLTIWQLFPPNPLNRNIIRKPGPGRLEPPKGHLEANASGGSGTYIMCVYIYIYVYIERERGLSYNK